jgi:hypothetical protein
MRFTPLACYRAHSFGDKCSWVAPENEAVQEEREGDDAYDGEGLNEEGRLDLGTGQNLISGRLERMKASLFPHYFSKSRTHVHPFRGGLMVELHNLDSDRLCVICQQHNDGFSRTISRDVARRNSDDSITRPLTFGAKSATARTRFAT